ncbi:hypothetical protein AQY21_20750 [Paracoccus sp. MKU1]|nr:hypothetical protein AQY21_20750 [Paracoccus sp. MKU1]
MVSGRYVRCRNVAEEPELDFEIDPEDMRAALAQGSFEGVIHSHPNGEAAPSESDMRGQIDTDVPWGIVILAGGQFAKLLHWGDHLLDEPLLGRQWVAGAFDCFALFRSHIKQTHGVVMPDIPRTDDWASLDTYATYANNRARYPMLEDIPLTEMSQIREGDALIMALMSSTPNHFAIYVGNNLILHHPADGLSSRRPLNTLTAKVTHILRFKEKEK